MVDRFVHPLHNHYFFVLCNDVNSMFTLPETIALLVKDFLVHFLWAFFLLLQSIIYCTN